MTTQDTKARILQKGAELVYTQGFNNTGIQRILESAGVPKGSFYFYFKSKEQFGLEIIDYFMRIFLSTADKHLRRADSSPLKRLRAFFAAFENLCREGEYRTGCPIGNITQEMGGLNDAFRSKLDESFQKMKAELADCLNEARTAGEIERDLDTDEIADFILNSWEGALLRMKAQQSAEPLALFVRIIFDRVLRG
jgi:TetR/AcrR family transcriptional repressor of nem operon